MFLVARKPATEPFKLKKYWQQIPYDHEELTDEWMLKWGEPYFISGKYEGRPVIKVLGPGTYWASISKEPRIIGAASEPKNKKKIIETLEARRRGDIYGRWYSEWCRKGEIGYVHFNALHEITEEEFEQERTKLCQTTPKLNSSLMS